MHSTLQIFPMEEWNRLHHTPSDPSNKEEYFKSQSIKATTLFQLQNLQIKSAEKERNKKRNLWRFNFIQTLMT